SPPPPPPAPPPPPPPGSRTSVLPRVGSLLARTHAGVRREDSPRFVQRNAMPGWRCEGDFLALLKADPEVGAALPAEQIEACFDLGYHCKHVDTIVGRVFG
ncbi:hypothetical protein CCS92_34530, partial [Methylobacterium radiotolerans]